MVELILDKQKMETENPDFLVLNKRTRKVFLWEHLGRMSEPSYAEKNIGKVERYARYGYFHGRNLLLTLESKEHPLRTETIDQIINDYLI